MMTLDKLCEHLQIIVNPFAVCSVREGEQLMLGPREEATVHYVVTGYGSLAFPEFSEFPLRAGTAIIAPTGSLHEVRVPSSNDEVPAEVRRCEPAALGLAAVGETPQDVTSGMVILCGTVDVTYNYLNDFYDYLPSPIVIQASPEDPISRAFDEIVREMGAPGPGTGSMLSALFQQCFIEILRRQERNEEGPMKWLAALDDPKLNQVVDDIIEKPGDSYSLDMLADRCLMSRTTFAKRFQRAFGRSAMDFVREVRLRAAAKMLRHTDHPTKTIASRMGYASRSNFSHAFTDFFGVTPVQYRESGAQSGEATSNG
jgi:AraC-like DNA-binding protein